MALIEKNEYQQAIILILDELQNEQNDWNLHALIAFCYRAIGDYENAYKNYSITLRLNPNEYSTLLGLGIVCQILGDYGNAIHILNRAIKLEPDRIEARNSLGLTHKKAGNLDTSIKNYEEAINTLVRNTWNGIKKKEKLTIKDVWDADNREFNKNFVRKVENELKNDILYATLENNIGVCYAEKGNINKAKEHFKRAIEFTPEGIQYAEPHIGLQAIN